MTQNVSLRTLLVGLSSFLIVLLFMPIGHTLMVLNEKVFVADKFLTAFALGGGGLFFLILGLFQGKRPAIATLMGLLAAILIWTGWVEFSFVWIAEKLAVAPLTENGEIVTKPEYLVMMSSLGVLSCVLLFFLFTQNRCQFFVWFQKLFRIDAQVKIQPSVSKPLAMITFIETVMLMWTFYVVLLLLYDEALVGDRHPLTYIAAFGSLIWAWYLFMRLIRIKKFDYAVRYAVPTTVIFWNFVEIMGRWDLLEEIWVRPFEHWREKSIDTRDTYRLYCLLCISKHEKPTRAKPPIVIEYFLIFSYLMEGLS